MSQAYKKKKSYVKKKIQDMGYFFHLPGGERAKKQKAFVPGTAETKNKEERNLPC